MEIAIVVLVCIAALIVMVALTWKLGLPLGAISRRPPPPPPVPDVMRRAMEEQRRRWLQQSTEFTEFP